MQEDTYRGTASDPLSLNLYTYCNNEPLMYHDPSGHIVSATDKKKLSKTQQDAINSATNAYNAAKAQGNRAAMDAAHAQAEAIRNGKGYTGGTAGSGNQSYAEATVKRITSNGVTSSMKGTVIDGKTYMNGKRVSAGSIVDIGKKQYIAVEGSGGSVSGKSITSDYAGAAITKPGFDGVNGTSYGWLVTNKATKKNEAYLYNGKMAGNLSVIQSEKGNYVVTSDKYVPVQKKDTFDIGGSAYKNHINAISKDKGNEAAYWQLYHDAVAPGNIKDQFDNFNSAGAEAFNSLVQNVVSGIGSNNITSDIHYSRNSFNRSFTTLDGLIQYNQRNGNAQWQLLGPGTAAYHMSGDGGEYNTKFISPDGMFEAVYDKNGNRVQSDINMGTYNFFGPSNAVNHSFYDVNTYYDHGNTLNDPALGSIDANIMANENLAKYDSNKMARDNYYNVLREANPNEYELQIMIQKMKQNSRGRGIK